MAGNFHFIKSVSGDNVSSLSITGFTNRFNVYAIYTPELTQAANNDVEARFNDANGDALTANYAYACQSIDSTAAHNDFNSNSADRIENIGVNDANETFGVGHCTFIYRPADSSSYTYLQHQSGGFRDTGNLRAYKTIGVHKVAQEVTGYRIFGRGGRITATMVLYGIK